MEELQSENDSLKEKAASYETKSRHLISTWYPGKAVRFILGVLMEIDIDEILKQARRTEISLRSKSLRLSAVSGSALLTAAASVNSSEDWSAHTGVRPLVLYFTSLDLQKGGVAQDFAAANY